MDKKYRELLTKVEEFGAKRNTISKKVSEAKAKKDEAAAAELQKEVAKMKKDAADAEKKAADLAAKLKEAMLVIPNLPHESVPTGKDETDNVEVHK
ncbi:MAG: hypothetical protein MJ223_03125 [Mycoplasmoidaceae bacterium]|nr:hypothetical protein [Mycoplasmoidaceae bacterium]